MAIQAMDDLAHDDARPTGRRRRAGVGFVLIGAGALAAPGAALAQDPAAPEELAPVAATDAGGAPAAQTATAAPVEVAPSQPAVAPAQPAPAPEPVAAAPAPAPVEAAPSQPAVVSARPAPKLEQVAAPVVKKVEETVAAAQPPVISARPTPAPAPATPAPAEPAPAAATVPAPAPVAAEDEPAPSVESVVEDAGVVPAATTDAAGLVPETTEVAEENAALPASVELPSLAAPTSAPAATTTGTAATTPAVPATAEATELAALRAERDQLLSLLIGVVTGGSPATAAAVPAAPVSIATADAPRLDGAVPAAATPAAAVDPVLLALRTSLASVGRTTTEQGLLNLFSGPKVSGYSGLDALLAPAANGLAGVPGQVAPVLAEQIQTGAGAPVTAALSKLGVEGALRTGLEQLFGITKVGGAATPTLTPGATSTAGGVTTAGGATTSTAPNFLTTLKTAISGPVGRATNTLSVPGVLGGLASTFGGAAIGGIIDGSLAKSPGPGTQTVQGSRYDKINLKRGDQLADGRIADKDGELVIPIPVTAKNLTIFNTLTGEERQEKTSCVTATTKCEYKLSIPEANRVFLGWGKDGKKTWKVSADVSDTLSSGTAKPVCNFFCSVGNIGKNLLKQAPVLGLKFLGI